MVPTACVLWSTVEQPRDFDLSEWGSGVWVKTKPPGYGPQLSLFPFTRVQFRGYLDTITRE